MKEKSPSFEGLGVVQFNDGVDAGDACGTSP